MMVEENARKALDLRTRTREIVFGVLRRFADQNGYAPEDIQMNTSLTDDMGLDSLVFLELIVDLEDALGLVAFSMSEWANNEENAAVNDSTFSVKNLIEVCVDLQEKQRSDDTRNLLV